MNLHDETDGLEENYEPPSKKLVAWLFIIGLNVFAVACWAYLYLRD